MFHSCHMKVVSEPKRSLNRSVVHQKIQNTNVLFLLLLKYYFSNCDTMCERNKKNPSLKAVAARCVVLLQHHRPTPTRSTNTCSTIASSHWNLPRCDSVKSWIFNLGPRAFVLIIYLYLLTNWTRVVAGFQWRNVVAVAPLCVTSFAIHWRWNIWS